MVKINKYIPVCLFKNLLSKGSLIHLIILIGIKKYIVYNGCGFNIDHSVIWIKSKLMYEVQGKITV